MKFINEHDDFWIARVMIPLGESLADRNKAAMEFGNRTCSRSHPGKINLQHTRILEVIRNIPLGDRLRQTDSKCRFTNTGGAKNGSILSSLLEENQDDLIDLFIPARYGIETIHARQLGIIPAILMDQTFKSFVGDNIILRHGSS